MKVVYEMEIKELLTFKKLLKKVRFHKLLKIKLCTINSNNTYKKLENEIGFLLFERGWDARLTEEGKLLQRK